MSDYSNDDFLGYGTILAMGDGQDPETFTAVAKVMDIDGPNSSVDTHESTAHDTPEYTKDYVMGLKDGGDLSFPIKLNPLNSTHDDTTGLGKTYNDRRKANYKLIWPIVGSIGFYGVTFKAGITKYNRKTPVNGIIMGDIGFKLTTSPKLEDIDISGIC